MKKSLEGRSSDPQSLAFAFFSVVVCRALKSHLLAKESQKMGEPASAQTGDSKL